MTNAEFRMTNVGVDSPDEKKSEQSEDPQFTRNDDIEGLAVLFDGYPKHRMEPVIQPETMNHGEADHASRHEPKCCEKSPEHPAA
jgi:hypothetical protein